MAEQGCGNGRGGPAGGASGTGGGGCLGGGSDVEVELHQLSGGDHDPEVAPFVLENCKYLGVTISSSLKLSA